MDKTNIIPLFWYANFNAYGYTQYGSIQLEKSITIDRFLDDIGNDLEEKLYEHEFVCRIPIPINNNDAGFLGKINKGILGIGQEIEMIRQLQRQQEEWLQRQQEELSNYSYNNNSELNRIYRNCSIKNKNNCNRNNKCFFNSKNGCLPTYKSVVKYGNQ